MALDEPYMARQASSSFGGVGDKARIIEPPGSPERGAAPRIVAASGGSEWIQGHRIGRGESLSGRTTLTRLG